MREGLSIVDRRDRGGRVLHRLKRTGTQHHNRVDRPGIVVPTVRSLDEQTISQLPSPSVAPCRDPRRNNTAVQADPVKVKLVKSATVSVGRLT